MVDVVIQQVTCGGGGCCCAALSTAGNVYTWGGVSVSAVPRSTRGSAGGGGIGGGSSGAGHIAETMTSSTVVATTTVVDGTRCQLSPKLVDFFASKHVCIERVWAGAGCQFVAAVRSLKVQSAPLRQIIFFTFL